MHAPITAVLNDDIVVGTVGGIPVSPSPFSAFQCHGIIIDVHITSPDEDIMTGVDVNRIRTRCLYPLRRRKDRAVEKPTMVTPIDMVGPKRTVDEVNILNGNILAMGDVSQPGPLRILVRALPVPLATYPELFPIVLAIAIDRSLSCDRETIYAISVDQCGEIRAGLPLDTGFHELEMGNPV